MERVLGRIHADFETMTFRTPRTIVVVQLSRTRQWCCVSITFELVVSEAW